MSLQKLPSIGALEAFLVVAERQSLKAAAPELNISISALSRRIQTLEAQLGMVLFERGARSLRLTEDGDALRQGVWPSVEMLQSSMAELKRRRARPRLRIGAPAGLTGYWLAPRLAAFRAAQPSIETSLETSDRALSRLGSGLDALILVEENHNLLLAERYRVQRLAPVTVQAVCSPALAARLGPSEWDNQLLLALREHPDWLRCWRRTVEAPSPPQQVETFDSMPVMLEAAVSGLGIALVPALLARTQIAEGRLADPFGVEARTDASYALVTRSVDTDTPMVLRFRAWLGEQMATDALPLG